MVKQPMRYATVRFIRFSAASIVVCAIVLVALMTVNFISLGPQGYAEAGRNAQWEIEIRREFAKQPLQEEHP